MDSSQYFALTSWALEPGPCLLLGCAAAVYIRGWLRIRTLYRSEHDFPRLFAYLAGLGAVFIATQSPLDSFDYLYLSAHMTQHLLLMMIAPPLILLGRPTIPLLRGLPKQFVKEGLAPFLHCELLKRAFDEATADGFTGTDEASLLERSGQEVHVVMGSPRNIKITTPGDLQLAELYMRDEVKS